VRKGSLIQLTAIALIAGAICTAVALAIPWLPVDAGQEAHRIHFVFWFTTAICIGVFSVVAAVLVYSVWKFRAGPDDDSDGPPVHGHTGLEIAWTAVPAVLVTAISIVSAIVLAQNGNAGANPLVVKVTAQQFAWSFTYPDGKTYGSLTIPEGRHVKLDITSNDVIHSFWVPQLSQKQDAVPGQHNGRGSTPTRTIMRWPSCSTGWASSPGVMTTWHASTASPCLGKSWRGNVRSPRPHRTSTRRGSARSPSSRPFGRRSTDSGPMPARATSCP